VFVNLWEGRIGAPMVYATVVAFFQRLQRRTGIYARPHMLRHTHATDLIRTGKWDLAYVAERLGHANIGTTGIYLHLQNADMKSGLAGLRGTTARQIRCILSFSDRRRMNARPTLVRSIDLAAVVGLVCVVPSRQAWIWRVGIAKTSRLEAALAWARDAAGDRNVAVLGGAEIIRQCIRGGLLDELRLHVILGGGSALFGGSTPPT